MVEKQKILRVGIIGAGEVAQVIHLPVLSLLSHLYTTIAICDVSKKLRDHCAQKFHIPLSTPDPDAIFSHPDIDVVLILTPDQFHEAHTVAALAADKHVMVEKPMALSPASAGRILAAEASSRGRVFVGYMRRHARSFTDTFSRELASIPRVLYARVRDFPGPNSRFVAQSGAFGVAAGKAELVPDVRRREAEAWLDKLRSEAFPRARGPMSDEALKFWRFLGTLGSHDLSLMREALGSPEAVLGVSVNDPFYSAIFDYRNRDGSHFAVTYESGLDEVPDFDAHLAVYGEKKRVMIRYDTPYVKGLPIKVTVQEVNAFGEMETREVLGSYEDAYTTELQELYECVVHGKQIKTSASDALLDLKLYDMMFRRWIASSAGQ